MNLPYPPPTDAHQTTGDLRFTTWGLLVLMTGVSVVLALYFGIGRAIGMAGSDFLQFGVMRLIYMLPMFVVWTVGLLIALRRRKSDGRRARLLTVVFAGLLLTTFVVDIAQMVLIFQITQGNANFGAWFMAGLSIVSVLLNTLWWVLLLVAIFGTGGRGDGRTEPVESDHQPQVLP